MNLAEHLASGRCCTSSMCSSVVVLVTMTLASSSVMLMMMMMVGSLTVFGDGVMATDAGERFRYPGKQERFNGYLDDLTGEDVFVDIKYGRLRGKRRIGEASAGGETFVVDWFLGVPFAQPPVGHLRFRTTAAPEPWNGTRNALRVGASCPQYQRHESIDDTLRLDEDCLYLNIYSPVPVTSEARNTDDDRQQQSLFPVMVYIHGGSYRVGSGNTYIGSHILAQHGVVVVTINYRLGVLGFLAGNGLLGGNYGLRDQIFALEWIRDCIGSFRGDPKRVTIFGNSAGGASVGIIAVSPKAEGLFQNAIVQSGSPLAFWAIHSQKTDPEKILKALSQKISCDQKSAPSLIECLRNVPWKDLISAAIQIPRLTPCGTDLRPVPDGAILPDSPRALLNVGLFKGQALMTGIVDSEMTKHMGILFLADLYKSDYPYDLNFDDGFDRETFVRVVRYVIVAKFGFDDTIADVIIHRYTNWTQNTSDPYENRRQYVNFLTDLSMWTPTVELAESVARMSRPTFLYTMQLNTTGGGGGGGETGRTTSWTLNHHQVELQYIFGSPFTGFDVDEVTPSDSYTDEDRQISRMMMTIWTNFAKTGDPSRGHVTQEPVVNWTQFNRDSGAFLRIVSTKATMRERYRWEFVALWNDILSLQTRTIQLRHPNSDNPMPTSCDKVALVTLIVGVLQVFLLVAILSFVLFRNKKSCCRNRPSSS